MLSRSAGRRLGFQARARCYLAQQAGLGLASEMLSRSAGRAWLSERDGISLRQAGVEPDVISLSFAKPGLASEMACRSTGGSHVPFVLSTQSATLSARFGTLFVTCRLTGSLPQDVVTRLRQETDFVKVQLAKLGDDALRAEELYAEYRRAFGRFDRALDRADIGPTWLKEEAIARLMVDALHHRDGKQYELIAFCIMLNHLHIVFTPLQAESGEPVALETIMHSYKRYTAQQANKVLQREGEFWQHESYDHVARNADELERIVAYVADNPVKAGLVRAKGCVAVDLREGAVERDDISLSRARLGLASEMASRFTSHLATLRRPSLRSYADLLLAYQVALVGSGDAGPGGQGAATTSSTVRRCGCWPVRCRSAMSSCCARARRRSSRLAWWPATINTCRNSTM